MAPQSLDSQEFPTQPGMLEVITASFGAGGSTLGAERGPSSLLTAGLIQQLQQHFAEINVTECSTQLRSPTIPESKVYPGMNRANLVSNFTNRLSEEVYAHVRQGKPVLTLGGDHSIAFGTLTGVAKAIRERMGGREIATIYVDAHADINTPETSPSGNMHGMPVAFASGIARRTTGPLSWIQSEHLINPNRLAYIGLRDVDDTEWEFIRRHGIKVYGMPEVREHGIETVMDMALEYIGDDTPIHLSYDIDGIDPQWAPNTGLPVPGGLSLKEGIHIAHRLHESGNLAAMDLVEVNPDVEPGRLDVTLQTGCDVICSALGAKRG